MLFIHGYNKMRRLVRGLVAQLAEILMPPLDDIWMTRWMGYDEDSECSFVLEKDSEDLPRIVIVRSSGKSSK